MPVIRYRSFEQAERDLWLEPGDPRIARTLRYLWSLTKGFSPMPLKSGVFKFRTIEQANASRAAWETEYARKPRDGKAKR